MARTPERAPSTYSEQALTSPAGRVDVESAGATAAAALNASQRWLKWAAQAEQQQAQALSTWVDSVGKAANEASHAGGWDDLFASHSRLLNAGLMQAVSSQSVLLSSWLALQTELAQQMQAQAAETFSAAAARSKLQVPAAGLPAAMAEAAPSPLAFYAQAQGSLETLMRRWTAALTPTAVVAD